MRDKNEGMYHGGEGETLMSCDLVLSRKAAEYNTSCHMARVGITSGSALQCTLKQRPRSNHHTYERREGGLYVFPINLYVFP